MDELQQSIKQALDRTRVVVKYFPSDPKGAGSYLEIRKGGQTYQIPVVDNKPGTETRNIF